MPAVSIKINSVKRTFLFMHIPKTGGTALTSFFRQAGMSVHLAEENNSISGLLRCSAQHFEYAICERIFNIDAFDFSFGVVRNPISRAKSYYLYALRNRGKQGALPTFDDWARFAVGKFRENSYLFDNHIRPQHEFLGAKIKKIYRYEDGLEDALADVLKNLRIEAKRDDGGALLEKRNTAQQHHGFKSSDVQMSDATHKMLCDFYSEDIDRFGYNCSEF